MPRRKFIYQALHHPLISLTILSLLWKCLILLVALASPGPGYDTSTQLFLFPQASSETISYQPHLRRFSIDSLVFHLVRWDSIYFAKIAEQGYLHEQQWAFSWGFSKAVAFLAKGLSVMNLGSQTYAVAGILAAHICHVLSVLALYLLTSAIFRTSSNETTAFVTAALHAFSPAGIFLSAPYAESLFSLLNFSGMLCYIEYRYTLCQEKKPTLSRLLWLLASGLCFLLATLTRGNGLLNVTMFAYDIIEQLLAFRSFQLSSIDVPCLLMSSIACFMILLGFAFPQWLAYNEYCMNASLGMEKRPWCSRLIPSIYSWVQDHYWNVGFLRYWTLSNLPLFFLAGPILWLVLQSSVMAFTGGIRVITSKETTGRTFEQREAQKKQRSIADGCIQRLAVPQFILAILAITSFHVQIMNRISSGYAVWYIVIAATLTNQNIVSRGRNWPPKGSEWVVRWMVIYTLVQGGLFASFLPPA